MKNLKKITSVLIACTVMLAGFGIMASAAERDRMPDLPDSDYSLTVKLASYNYDNTKTAIEGAEISIYQVAGLTVKGGAAIYDPLDTYRSAVDTFEGISTKKSNEIASDCNAIVKEKGINGKSGKTGADGETVFSNLAAGIYLVSLAGFDNGDAGYTEMDPYLVQVPGIDATGEGNSWICNVISAPKIPVRPVDLIKTNPPVIKKIDGNPSKDSEFIFELVAGDVTNPMPEGSFHGVKQITITGEGENEFGEWKYTEPGTYKYTVREVNTGEKGYIYDDIEYHLTDKVYYQKSKLKMDRTLLDGDGNKIDNMEFTFTNKYKPGFFIKTGDISGMRTILIILILAAAALLITAYIRRKEGK